MASLHAAAEAGDVDKVRTLIQQGKYPVNYSDSNGHTPLHYACLNNHLNVVRVLVLEFNANVNIQDNSGSTPLHFACEHGHVGIVQALILLKADVNAYSKLVGTPLHVACRAGKQEVLLSLMSAPSCDPNMKDQDGQTVLHLACKTGNIDLVNALLHTHKMDVNALNERKETPLHVALASNQHQVALALVKEHGCDITVLDIDGWTVLHVVCKQGAIDLVHALIRDMTDINVRTNKNDTPLIMAAWGGHYDVVLALVNDARCDPSARGDLGRTALHVAAYRGHHKIVQELLKYTSPLLVDEFGNTPLHLASQDSHVSTVQCLLHDNAPVLVRNAKGDTPRDLAQGECGRIIEEYRQVNHKQLRDHYSTILRLADRRYFGSHWITRIFVVGNPGAGKSSLIESLKREGFFESFRKVSESAVPPHTAGIIPSVHMSSQYGRVLFYDFAGDAEYYSSYAVIFERLASSKKGNNIFIVVVDLRKDGVTIKTTLHYWFSFAQKQKFTRPSFIVVGSHLDQSVEQSGCLVEFCTAMQPNVYNIKHFMLDCRDPRSSQIVMKQIHTWVSESQKYELSSEARLLLGLLEKDFSAVPACPVQTLVSHIKDCGGWLPVEPKPLHQILLELHEVGVLLLLGDCTKDTDHVILNMSILSDIKSLVTHTKKEFESSEQSQEFCANVKKHLESSGTINRFLAHLVFVGLPGSGKTTLILRLLSLTGIEKMLRLRALASTGVMDGIISVNVLEDKASFYTASIDKNYEWHEVQFGLSCLRQMGIQCFVPNEISKSGELLRPPSLNAAEVSATTTERQNIEAQETLIEEAQFSKTKLNLSQLETATVQQSLAGDVMETVRRLLAEQGFSAVLPYLDNKTTLYLSDTGGQIEFQELLPLLVALHAIFVFLFPLNVDLDAPVTVSYRKKVGDKLEHTNVYTSSLTIRESFLQTLASIDSKDDGVNPSVAKHKPYVFVVGTHKDCLINELGEAKAREKIAEIDSKFKLLVEEHKYDNMVVYADKVKNEVLFAVDNTCENNVFPKIRQSIIELLHSGNEFCIEFPLSYLLASLHLQSKSEPFINRSEFAQEVLQYGIEEEDIDHLLQFLHTRIGQIRYFPLSQHKLPSAYENGEREAGIWLRL